MAKIIPVLQLLIFREGKHFIAYSPALDLSTSAQSYEEVKNRFNEVLKVFFEELVSKGTIEEVLRNLGWEKIRDRWQPPPLISQEYVSIETSTLEKI